MGPMWKTRLDSIQLPSTLHDSARWLCRLLAVAKELVADHHKLDMMCICKPGKGDALPLDH